MPSLVNECESLFGTKDLYAVMGVNKSASEFELKRAYHKMSLKVHPDRVKEGEKANATTRFQILGKVYSNLSDKDRRAAYDETGEVVDDDDACMSQDKDWMQYWRTLFKQVSLQDIQEFETRYKGSEEEVVDLKQAYLDCEGDMDHILDSVMCATVDDEDRFRKILQPSIKNKELPIYKRYTNAKLKKQDVRKRKAAAEAKEAESHAKELGMNQSDSLKALILKRNQAREGQMDDFLSNLEAKYASKPKKGKKK